MRYRSALFGFTLLLSVCLFPLSAHAQQGLNDVSDLGNALRTISGNYADNYVQPLTNTFGSGINSGLFRSADVGNSLVPGFPVNVYLGVSVTGPFTSSMNKSFRPFGDGQATFTQNGQDFIVEYEGSGKVPTIFGENEPPGPDLVIGADLNGNGNIESDEEVSRAKAPQGLVETPITPLIIPQLGVGSFMGTDMQIRYFPQTSLSLAGDGYGKVGMFGLAVRHDLDQWVPAPLPLNIAVQGAWNQFSLENTLDDTGETKEVLDASGWAFNLQVSKGLPVAPITFYSGLQYESFNVDYNYTIPSQSAGTDDLTVSLSQSSDNNVRGLFGVTFTAAVVRINVDYAVGNAQNVLTTGFGVRL